MDSVKDYAIIMLDRDGKVTTWNAGAEKLLGYSEREVLGHSFSLFFTPEDVQLGLPERELKTAREKGKAHNDSWQQRKDGSRFWASGVVSLVVDGQLKGYAAVLRDVSEQKAMQEALEESEARYRKLAAELETANRRKDQFMAMLSHELRSPLAPVLTALQVMRQDSTTNPLQLQARKIIERQVRQLAHLVDDLLEISRLTAGKIKLHKEHIEVGVILDRAIETVRPLLETHGHRFMLNAPDKPIRIFADSLRVEQVVVNLLTNAAKYTPEQGIISLSVYEEGDQAVIQVKDTGIGIEPELLPRIFDLFTQAEKGLSRADGGLGIGLAVVKALVEMQDGSVQASSAGRGKGSEFVVRLPLFQAATHDDPRDDMPSLPSKPPALKLLIVDDNIDAADSLAMLLRLDGHHVHVAYNGSTAIKAAVANRPHVVLLDIGLPGMDGYEVAAGLRNDPATQKSVLIALTGYGQESDKIRAKEVGFDHHMVKPVDPEQLQRVLGLFTDTKQRS